MDRLQSDYEEAAKATLADARAAASKYAKADRFGILLVVDRAKIEPGITDHAMGEVVVLDAEGKPAK